MLGWILIFAASCVVSAFLGLGYLVPMAGNLQGVFLTLTAFLAMLLVAACDAFETQGAVGPADDSGA